MGSSLKKNMGKEKKFRLLSIHLKDNKIFDDLSLNLVNQNDEETLKQPYISLIIGANGTGKSNLMASIVNIFRELYSLKYYHKRSNTITGFFRIEYILDGDFYVFGNYYPNSMNFASITGRKKLYQKPIISKNNKQVSFSEVEFPKMILASSLMLTDKFYNDVKNTLPFYKYLGVRTSSNQSGTRTYIRRTVNMLLDSFDTENAILTRFYLGDLLEKLEFERKLVIHYNPRYKKVFFNENEPLTADKIIDFFENYQDYTKRTTPPWGYKRLEKIKHDTKLLDRIAKACNRMVEEDIYITPPDTKSKVLSFDILNNEFIFEFVDVIKELSRLDILSFPELIFLKNKKYFNYKESSSGEQNIITTLISIMSQIKDSSLVLLDEPEVSLHPNWQMKYINEFLIKIFENYSSCHFIITSHSHFLVSDLRPENSHLIGITHDQEGIKINYPIPENTFGWSAEQVLFKAFNVATTRNYYLEIHLREMLHLISENSSNKTKIKELLDVVKQVSVSDSDPLREIIKETEIYLSK